MGCGRVPALRAGAAIVGLRLRDRVFDVRTVRIRFVHRTRGVVPTARHPRLGRRLPPRAHVDVPNTERQENDDRGRTLGQCHRLVKNAGLELLCQIGGATRIAASERIRLRFRASADKATGRASVASESTRNEPTPVAHVSVRHRERQVSRVSVQGSLRGEAPQIKMAGSTGLEPAASGVTGRRSNQLNYDPAKVGVTSTRVGRARVLQAGGRYRTRTCDSRRVKPVLYQLS